MDVRTIRRFSAVVLVVGWLAAVITAVVAVRAPAGERTENAIAIEVLLGALAATATVAYVAAALTDHIDDTQWDVDLSDRLAQVPSRRKH